MAKKKKPEPKPLPVIEEQRVMRHARIELPDEDYQRLKRAAERYRISAAAYIRQAVIKQIERDETKGGG